MTDRLEEIKARYDEGITTYWGRPTVGWLIAENEWLQAQLSDCEAFGTKLFKKAQHEKHELIDSLERAMAQRDALAARLAAVEALHVSDGGKMDPYCRQCGWTFPCPTVRAARGEA